MVAMNSTEKDHHPESTDIINLFKQQGETTASLRKPNTNFDLVTAHCTQCTVSKEGQH